MMPRKPAEYKDVKGSPGFSLVELMVAIVVVSLFMVGVFALFTNFLGKSGEQASRAKRGFDARLGLNLVKRDLVNAGFGIVKTDLDGAIAGTASSITIRSTAVHARASESGQHGFIQNNGDVADGMGGVIDSGLRGVAMTPDRDQLEVTNRGALTAGPGNLFFVGNQDGTEPYYYERSYVLGGNSSECEGNTSNLRFNDTNGGVSGVVNCVLDLRFRYGFEDNTGAVQFTTDPDSPPATAADDLPDLLKVGLMLQVTRSPEANSSPASLGYTDNDLSGVTVNLSASQQQFRWQRMVWSLPLENLQ